MTGFKLNHVYRLKKEYRYGYLSRKLVEEHNKGRMTIHIDHYAFAAKNVIDGNVVDTHNAMIISVDDYHCFTEFKPFKANGTYRLRDEYVIMYNHNEYTRETFGNTAFTFTVDKIMHGSAYVEEGDHTFLIACPHERHMFKRIDNK